MAPHKNPKVDLGNDNGTKDGGWSWSLETELGGN